MTKTAATFLSIAAAFAVVFSAQAQPPGPPGPGMGRGFGPRGDIMAGGPHSRTPVTGAPYSGTESTQRQQTLQDGNNITNQQQSKVYRDSEGRVRMEHTETPRNGSTAAGKTIVTIFDPVAGFSYWLDPVKMTAVKSPLPMPPASSTGATHPQRPARPGVTVTSEDLGTQVINGLSATGTRTTETIAANTFGNAAAIVSTRDVWISTDLKVPVQIKSTDPRFGTSTSQLINVTRTEPDAALFQVPGGMGAHARRWPLTGIGSGLIGVYPCSSVAELPFYCTGAGI